MFDFARPFSRLNRFYPGIAVGLLAATFFGMSNWSVAAEKSPQPAAGPKLGYNQYIRPILSENCFYCHGNDKNHRKSGLRLDQSESALKGGKSGDPAIVPGHPEKSVLIDRIASTDPDDLM